MIFMKRWIMKCRICGNEIHDEAVICVNCGCATKTDEIIDEKEKKYRSATALGVVLTLIFGLIAYLIGVVIFSKGTYEIKTYMKGFKYTFFTILAVEIIAGIILILTML